MKFQGDIHSIPITDVAQNLSANKKSGTLTIHRPDEVRHIAFRDGNIISYADTLGFSVFQWLQDKGLVDTEKHAKVLARYSKGSRRPLGELLARAGVMPREDYLGYLKDLVADVLYETFTFRDGSFEFHENSFPAEAMSREINDEGLEFPVGPILLEAARRLDDWETIRKCIPLEDDIYRISASEKATILRDLGDNETAIAAVELLDGTRSIREVIAQIPASRFESCWVIADLVSRKKARPVDSSELVEKFNPRSPKERARMLKRLKAALEREPGNRAVIQKVAELSLAEGRREDSGVYHKLLSSALADDGNLEGAEKELRLSLQLNPKDIGAWQKLYELIEQHGNPKALLEYGLEMTRHLRKMGLDELARDYLARMLEKFPNQVPLRFEHAETLFALGDRAGAIDRLLELARDHLKRKEMDQAERALTKVIEYDREHKRAKEILEKIRTGKLERARARRKQLIRAAVTITLFAAVSFFIGYDFYVRREFALTTRQVLAEGLIERGRYQEALERLESVERRHPVSLLRFLESREILRTLEEAVRKQKDPSYGKSGSAPSARSGPSPEKPTAQPLKS